ncbi:MAG: hypothetical protein WD226_13480 [Planctomycetota bacterium]
MLSTTLRGAGAAWLATVFALFAGAQEPTVRAVHGLGPIDFDGGSKAVATPTGFEAALLARVAAGGPGPDLDAEVTTGGRTLAWRELEPNGRSVAVDLAATFGTEAPSVAYLWLALEAPEACTVRVRCGSDDGLRLWAAGALVVEAAESRGLDTYAHRLELSLVAGTNHVLAKVAQDGGAWSFHFAFDGDVSPFQKERLQPAIHAAIERGLAYLLDAQEPDGSWRFHQDQYPNGQTALALFTLLKCGLTLEHPAVQRARLWLMVHPPKKTYSTACQLLAFVELRDPSLAPYIESYTDLLIEWQTSRGWDYPGGHVDLSNHQFAALGLAAAAETGVTIRAKIWESAGEQALRWQAKDGGFSYTSSKQPTGSMTVAGLTTLGICRAQLARLGKLSNTREREWKQAADKAFDWLGVHWTPAKNPVPWNDAYEERRWYPYYLYGVERACTFYQRTLLERSDWYWEGARALVQKQGDAGDWSTIYGEPQPNTCFALLFLRRATAATSGSTATTTAWGESDATAAVRLRGTGRGPLTVWLDGFGAELTSAHAWPAVRGAGLRVESVAYLVDGEPHATVPGDPSAAWSNERFPARLSGLASGERSIAARVLLVSDTGERTAVESKAFDVVVGRESPPWMLDYAEDRGRNLLDAARFDVEVSSADGDGNLKKELAVDNLIGTGWLSAAGDTRAWIELDLARAVRAETLVLSQMRPEADDPEAGCRVTRVRIIVNGKDRNGLDVELEADPLRKTAVDLGKAVMIRKLRIEILDFEPGEKRTEQVGFAEIELR